MEIKKVYYLYFQTADIMVDDLYEVYATQELAEKAINIAIEEEIEIRVNAGHDREKAEEMVEEEYEGWQIADIQLITE